MSWAGRRQLLYAGAALLALLSVAGFIAYSALSTPPMCTDGARNGGETGVDCGGPCSRLCPNEARLPVVLWTRAFETSPGAYSAAAYVENVNSGAGAKRVSYAFRLFDENNLLIVQRDGVTDIPPQETVPIFEGNIPVGTRTVARAFLEFAQVPAWDKVATGELPAVRITDLALSQDGSRLSATVNNIGASEVRDLTLVAVLFDANGTARNASESLVARIPRGSSEVVVFTWPGGTPGLVRAEITPVPAL